MITIIMLILLYCIPFIYVLKWAVKYMKENPHLSGVEHVMYLISAFIPGVNLFIFISNLGEGSKL